MPVKRPRLNENNKRSIVIPLSQKNAYLGFYDGFRANTIFRLYFNSQKEIISLFLLFFEFLSSALFLKSSEMPEKRPRLNENNKRYITIPPRIYPLLKRRILSICKQSKKY